MPFKGWRTAASRRLHQHLAGLEDRDQLQRGLHRLRTARQAVDLEHELEAQERIDGRPNRHGIVQQGASRRRTIYSFRPIVYM